MHMPSTPTCLSPQKTRAVMSTGPRVVEILVIDDDLDAEAFPDITVNGDAVAMTRTNDGNWYAYIADTAAVADVNTGRYRQYRYRLW